MEQTPGSSRLAAWRPLALSGLCGALLVLAFAPFGLWPLAPLGLAGWLGLFAGLKPRQAFWSGWLFGLGLFGGGVNWVHISIHQYGHSPLPAALAVTLLLIAYLALFPALAAGLARRLAPGRPGFRLLLLVFPSLWVLTEWLRGWLFTGFPWLNPGYSQIDAPLSGFAPLLGVYGLDWLLALSAGLLVYLLSRRGRLRWAAAGLLLLIWLAGSGLRGLSWTEPAGAPLRLSLIQGNISQELKWVRSQRQATLARYLEMTRREWAEWQPRLVIWPETAIPAFYHEVEDGFLAALRAEAADAGSDLLTGVPVLDRESWRYYNAVINLEAPTGFYYKRHLVPFGEYLPLREWLGGLLQVMPLPVADFSAGEGPPLLTAAGQPVGMSICYEVIFGEELLDALPEAGLLVNVSNDAWFGDSLAPHQHLEMARMRALETGRYLLRATNTGISAVIAPDGRLSARSPQFQPAVVRDTVRPYRGTTPYVKSGNGPLFALLVLLLSAAARRGRGA
ncbi:apolipoprotein N-acyltransferase [Thiohalobacter sp. IOR34]|uniref:apolipoprotein N-acyltransferase n=1 Tax=Thiohalobacter sp. IOR34 TaxID=3057176 RepID=UPI0025B0D20C|nr:apolipoprotein N-acyltransferase [Thiohalobacter sp. IOR34]WJW74888.1 apolipoprotein N-acyltransferase [Thiohalobacter sp. IOR34]